MKRKVIQLAHKTLVVSLPSKWVKKYGVSKGGELEVEEKGQQITFFTEKTTERERITIDAGKISESALKRWVLSSLHKSGYDEIEILYKDAKIASAIQQTVQDMLIGFAVVEQGRERCVIKNVATEQEKEFDTILRRAFLVTKNMGEGISEYLAENKQAALGELLVLEKTNNQLTNFCERILNKKGYKNSSLTCFAYVIVWNLEKICDHYKDLCRTLGQIKNPGTQIKELIKQANQYFSEYYELFYTFEMDRLKKLESDRESIAETARRIMEKGKEEAIAAGCILEFTTKVSDMTASYIALNN